MLDWFHVKLPQGGYLGLYNFCMCGQVLAQGARGVEHSFRAYIFLRLFLVMGWVGYFGIAPVCVKFGDFS